MAFIDLLFSSDYIIFFKIIIKNVLVETAKSHLVFIVWIIPDFCACKNSYLKDRKEKT